MTYKSRGIYNPLQHHGFLQSGELSPPPPQLNPASAFSHPELNEDLPLRGYVAKRRTGRGGTPATTTCRAISVPESSTTITTVPLA